MTKKYFITLTDYNIWANDIVHSWLDKISNEQWKQVIISSFPALSTTTLHLAAAETIWLDRLNKAANPRLLMETFKGGKKEVQEAWKEASIGLKSFIENFDETNLQEILSFKRITGDTRELPFYQVFAHVFNHSTYHRGQIVTMLRQVGFADVQSTDLSTYFWSKTPKSPEEVRVK